jgi:hypothetical protein
MSFVTGMLAGLAIAAVVVVIALIRFAAAIGRVW